MSKELQEILSMLEIEIAKRKNLPNMIEEMEKMSELLFEAANTLKPITVATLRHIASLKLRKDGVCDYYEVSNKQIRDLFEKHNKSHLLPTVQKAR